jgi:hypothetical protein
MLPRWRPNLGLSDYHLFGPQSSCEVTEGAENTVRQWLQRREISFAGRGNVLSSKGGRRLETKMETALKINGAFSNVAVKFFEISHIQL